jgi:hypothetical protein
MHGCVRNLQEFERLQKKHPEFGDVTEQVLSELTENNFLTIEPDGTFSLNQLPDRSRPKLQRTFSQFRAYIPDLLQILADRALRDRERSPEDLDLFLTFATCMTFPKNEKILIRLRDIITRFYGELGVLQKDSKDVLSETDEVVALGLIAGALSPEDF